jgi:oligopeptide transport system ATP-binding protein
MNILEVKNLNLGFETESGFKQALYDVSFSLEKGKIHAIVGESGCGKTMSAMSIINLLPKTAKIISGEILLKEQDILSLSSKELEKIRGAKIALIPQDPMTSLNPLYTIGNQLIEVIKKHQDVNDKEAKERAIKSLELVQIPDAENRLNIYPHEFSGGMKQRAILQWRLHATRK